MKEHLRSETTQTRTVHVNLWF